MRDELSEIMHLMLTTPDLQWVDDALIFVQTNLRSPDVSRLEDCDGKTVGWANFMVRGCGLSLPKEQP